MFLSKHNSLMNVYCSEKTPKDKKNAIFLPQLFDILLIISRSPRNFLLSIFLLRIKMYKKDHKTDILFPNRIRNVCRSIFHVSKCLYRLHCPWGPPTTWEINNNHKRSCAIDRQIKSTKSVITFAHLCYFDFSTKFQF